MKFQGILKVEDYVVNEMNRILSIPDSSIKKDGIEFDREFVFENGTRMAIQVCSSLNPSEEPCWTQGVLFDQHGNELGCTDVGESFLGEYHVFADDIEYIVDVQVLKKCKACNKEVPTQRECQCFCSEKCEHDSFFDSLMGPMCTCD